MTPAERHLHAFLTALGPVPGKRRDFLAALAHEPPANLERLYWLARVTLVSRVEDIPFFDAVFAAYFRGGALPREAPPDEQGESEAPEGQGEAGAVELAEGTGKDASPLDLRRERRFDPPPASVEHAFPRARARRKRPAKRGELDLRRTLRSGELRWRAKPQRVRPIVVLIDVSGSQREHSLEYLGFARAVLDVADRAEAFTFGTRLTRVTGQLRRGELEVPDADGGTQIGASLETFLRRHLHLARGALVIVLSDGLERGDPTPMARAVERLSRLAHRIVWWTPLAADPTYRPVTRGLQAVLPNLDQLAGAHDLEARINDVRRVCARPRRQAIGDW